MPTGKWKACATFITLFLGWLLYPAANMSAGTVSKPVVAVVVAYKDYNIVAYQEMQAALQESSVLFENVSTQIGTARSGSHLVEIDHQLSSLDTDRYAAIVFLGGFGALDDLVDNPEAMALIRSAAVNGKIVGGA